MTYVKNLLIVNFLLMPAQSVKNIFPFMEWKQRSWKTIMLPAWIVNKYLVKCMLCLIILNNEAEEKIN